MQLSIIKDGFPQCIVCVQSEQGLLCLLSVIEDLLFFYIFITCISRAEDDIPKRNTFAM